MQIKASNQAKFKPGKGLSAGLRHFRARAYCLPGPSSCAGSDGRSPAGPSRRQVGLAGPQRSL
jgi:hypothetical protein